MSLKESVGAVVKGDDHGTLLVITAIASVACLMVSIISPRPCCRGEVVMDVAAVQSRTKEIEDGDLVINKLTGAKGVFVDTGWDAGRDYVRFINGKGGNENDYTISAWRLARPEEQ